jgi:hypothetical protein
MKLQLVALLFVFALAEAIIKLPLKYHAINTPAFLKAKQQARLAKLGPKALASRPKVEFCWKVHMYTIISPLKSRLGKLFFIK